MEKLIMAVLIGLVGTLVVGFGHHVYIEYKYPCQQYEDRQATCGGGLSCTFMDGDGNCMGWTTDDEYPCVEKVCVKRGVR